MTAKAPPVLQEESSPCLLPIPSKADSLWVILGLMCLCTQGGLKAGKSSPGQVQALNDSAPRGERKKIQSFLPHLDHLHNQNRTLSEHPTSATPLLASSNDPQRVLLPVIPSPPMDDEQGQSVPVHPLKVLELYTRIWPRRPGR